MKLHALSVTLIVSATVFVFAQVRNFDFVNFDDGVYVADNSRLWDGFTWDDVRWTFSTTRMGAWHPLVWLSYFLDAELFGRNAGGFHTTNLLIHLANSLLLYVALFQMTGTITRSMLVALLFAIHPLHVEPVAWVSSRKDVLSAFFGFVAILAYVRYTHREKRIWLAASALAFACSLMSKQMLVTLPFLLIILDVWPLRRIRLVAKHDGSQMTETDLPQVPVCWRRILLEKAPFIVLTLAFSCIAIVGQRTEGYLASLDEIPFSSRIANAVVTYTLYMFQTVWPFKLAVNYPYPSEPYSGMLLAGSAALLLGITVVAVFLRHRRPSMLMGWLWFLGTLVPVIGIVQVGNQQMADRYSYIPLIGLFVALVWNLVPASRLRRAAIASFAVVIIVCAVCARRQTTYWENSYELFSHAVEVTANNSVAHNNLGLALLEDLGQAGKAIPHFRKAIQIDPRNAKAHVNLGNVFQRNGNLGAAIEQYQLALVADPNLAQAHYFLGLTLQRQGHFKRAVPHFEEFVKSEPRHAMAHNNLATALQFSGRHDEALRQFKTAVRLAPNNPDIRVNLGTALHMSARFQEAIACYREVIVIDSGYGSAHLGLARAYSDIRNFPLARRHFAIAVRTSPNNAQFHDEFGTFLMDRAEFDLAILEFQTALRIRPDSPSARANLDLAILKKQANASSDR